MDYMILSINPGSTSTKIALYKNDAPLFEKTIRHHSQELEQFATLMDQLPLRQACVIQAVEENGVSLEELSAVVGRGGMLPPVKGGGYLVNQEMLDELQFGRAKPHASNLGALIAYSIAQPLGIPSYIYDAVATDELKDVARITGIPEISRQSFCHVLNAKATARKVAQQQGGSYQEKNFVVAHIGGGISISAHEKGRIIDVITDDAGPFSPERSGSVPLGYIIDICYGGGYTKKELLDKIKKQSGIMGHLGTNDGREVQERIEKGDEHARQVYDAEAYQIAKGIGSLAPALCGKLDAVILTGGLAHSTYLTDQIKRRVAHLGPVVVVPGEDEMEALTLGALRILRGEEGYHLYGQED